MSECTKIIIRDMRLDMLIGVYEGEQNALQPVLINLTADVTPPEDWRADDYRQVVCYARMIESIKAIAAKGHIQLAETFAAHIADMALMEPRVRRVQVRVEKLEISPDAIVGVDIIRSRQAPALHGADFL